MYKAELDKVKELEAYLSTLNTTKSLIMPSTNYFPKVNHFIRFRALKKDCLCRQT